MLERFSVKKPYTVIVGILLVLVLGVISLMNMSTDLLPAMNLPYVVVYTTSIGSTAEKVEREITRPMEASFSTLTGMKEIVSTSSDNVSVVIMEFAGDTDMNTTMIELSTAVDLLKGNWDDTVGTPTIMKINPDMLPVSIVSVSRGDMDIVELSAFAEELAAEYEAVPGVASATPSGLVKQSVRILLSEEKIADLNSRILREIDSELADMEQQLKDGQAQLDSAKAELASQKSGALAQIDGALSQLDGSQEQLDAAIAELETQRETLQTQLDEVNAGIEAYETAMSEVSAEDVQAALTELVGYAALQQRLAETQQSIEAIGTPEDAEELQEQIDALAAEREALEARRSAIQGEVDIYSAMDPEGTQARLAGLEEQLAGKQAEAAAADATIAQKQAEADAAAEALAALAEGTEEYAAKQAEISALEEELESLREGRSTIQGELDALATQRDEAAAALAAMEEAGVTSSEDAQSKLSDAQGRLADAEAEVADVDSRIAALEARVAQSGEDAESLQALEAEKASLEEQIADFEAGDTYQQWQDAGSLQEQISQYAQLQIAKGQLEDGIAQIDSALESLRKGVVPGGLIEGIDEDTDLAAARSQLESAKSQADSGFSAGEGAIAEGETQLEEAWKEFEAGRDAAFEQANLSGVITMETVAQILGAQDFDMPVGYIASEDGSHLVSVGERVASLEELENLKLFSLGMETLDAVRLKDVAEIAVVDDRDSGFTRVDGKNGVLLSFEKQSTYSTADVGHAIREKTEELTAKYQDLRVVDMFNQSDYIDLVIHSVLENLLYGGILAVLVLLLFMMDIRPTLIVALSIPVSVVAAFVCMYFSGVTLNVLSLSGLALGIGMLVDNSIVSIENIYRLHNDEKLPVLKSCVEGVRQVSGSLVASTLTTICVFVPVLFVTGLARDLFSDLGLTIAFSLVASLVVAMTFVPSMSAVVLRGAKPRKHRLFDRFQRGYGALLKGALRVKPLVLLAAAALLAYTVLQVPKMGMSFMPQVNSTQMSASLSFDDEVDTDSRRAAATALMERVMGVEGVYSVGVTEGGGMLSMGSINSAGGISFYIILDENSGRKNADVAREISAIGEEMGMDLAVKASTMDISMLTGSGITMNIVGDDLSTTQRIALELSDLARSVEGVAKVEGAERSSVPELKVIVDKELAMDKGLTVAQVYMALAKELSGSREFMSVDYNGREISVYIGDDRLGRLQPETLAGLDIETQVTRKSEEGLPETVSERVRLGDIARIEDTVSSTSIRRENQRRLTSITASLKDGYAVNLVSAELESLVADYALPEGYTIEFDGENEAIMSIMDDMILMVLVALSFIFLIMVAQFQSFKSPLIVMFTIPLAFTGGLLALLLTGMDLSVIAVVGFLVLSGVVVNNGIVFIDCVNQLRIGGLSKKKALVRAGKMRLRPILMTAMTTILGMLLMGLGTGMGAEMMQPMAIVTIGGLVYATLMTLFVVPCLYDLFNGEKLRSREIEMIREASGLRSMEDVLNGGASEGKPAAEGPAVQPHAAQSPAPAQAMAERAPAQGSGDHTARRAAPKASRGAADAWVRSTPHRRGIRPRTGERKRKRHSGLWG